MMSIIALTVKPDTAPKIKRFIFNPPKYLNFAVHKTTYVS